MEEEEIALSHLPRMAEQFSPGYIRIHERRIYNYTGVPDIHVCNTDVLAVHFKDWGDYVTLYIVTKEGLDRE